MIRQTLIKIYRTSISAQKLGLKKLYYNINFPEIKKKLLMTFTKLCL